MGEDCVFWFYTRALPRPHHGYGCLEDALVEERARLEAETGGEESTAQEDPDGHSQGPGAAVETTPGKMSGHTCYLGLSRLSCWAP